MRPFKKTKNPALKNLKAGLKNSSLFKKREFIGGII